MTLCPLCHEGLKTHRTPGVQHYSCGTLVRQTGATQALTCRVRQLERLLADVLPLAQSVSCVPNEHGRLETSCCHWAELVKRIEAAGIVSREEAQESRKVSRATADLTDSAD